MKHPKIYITLTYYLALILIVLTAMICFHYSTMATANGNDGVVFYSVILWYVIISFPAAFSGFSILVKRLNGKPEQKQQKLYVTYAIIRITIIFAGFIASIIGLYFLHNRSLLWLAGICAIGLILCKPTDAKIESDLDKLRSPDGSERTDDDNQ